MGQSILTGVTKVGNKKQTRLKNLKPKTELNDIAEISIYLLFIIFIHQFIRLHILCDNGSHFSRLQDCIFPVGTTKHKSIPNVQRINLPM